MSKKIFSLLLAFTLIMTSSISVFAMSEEIHEQISGNTLLIGNYLFELDSNDEAFDLNSFINSARSIEEGKDSAVYYKDASGNWFELVSDSGMGSKVAIKDIGNKITIRNGKVENADPMVLTASDILYSPKTIVESTTTQGVFETEVTVTIKDSNNAKFASNITATVDTISSASIVETIPTGTNMSVMRVDDKNIKLKLTGVATSHGASINKTVGGAKNQKDHNSNGIFGDVKFLMLPEFFTGISTVKDGGQYVVLDVQYNDLKAANDEILDKVKSQLLTIENVDYGVLVLKQGTVNDYNFTINDSAFQPTKVNDSGSVVKFEMNRKEVAAIKVIDKSDKTRVDTITIGSGTENFTSLVKDQDPDRVMASGKISYFEYYLVDYDESGVIRSTLEKTTFDTNSEGVVPEDKTVPKLTLNKERTPLGDDIIMNVSDPTSALSKEWMANVYEVLKDYDASASSRVPVQFRADLDNGRITILANSTAIDDRNGHHEVVIKSNSFNDIHVNFEIVEAAGDLYLSPNFNWYSNDELLFELQEFNYAVTNPIYGVYLDGKKLDGDCKEYHVVSNLIRLENDALPKLNEGEHTLVIKINGFEDYSRTFTLEKAPNGLNNPTYGSPDDSAEKKEQASIRVDAVSAATGASSGSTSSGDSDGSGGGGAIRANVIFNFDHISNAFILTGLGMDTPYCEAVINDWKHFTKDAVIKDGSDVLVDYKYFSNKLGVNGEFATFEELFATMPEKNPQASEYMDRDYVKPANLYLNRPYSVKNVMHDGQLGDIYSYGEVTALPAPSLSIENASVKYGDDIVIGYAGVKDDEWADALINVKVNSAYLKFVIDKNNKTLIFENDQNSFSTGENNFKFIAEGYTTEVIQVTLHKETPENISLSKDDDDNIVVGTFTSEYMRKLNGIYLDGKGLFNDDQVGGNGGSYHIVGEQLILRDKLFGINADQYALDTQHTLKIEANGYGTVVKNFTPGDLIDGNLELLTVPEYVALSDNNKYRTGQDVSIAVEKNFENDYKLAIEKIYVDGIALDDESFKYDFYDLLVKGVVFDTEKDYAIKITATDFKDIEFSITVSNNAVAIPTYVTFAENTQSLDMGSGLILNFDDPTDGILAVSDYGKAITEIRINSKSYTEGINNNEFDISSKVLTGLNTITMKATGYVDKVFTVTVNEVAGLAKLLVEGEESDQRSLTIDMPKEINISLGDSSNAVYMDVFSSLLIDGTPLTNEQFEISKSYKKLTIKADNFSHGQSYELVVKADGYADRTFTIEVEAEGSVLDVPMGVGLKKDYSEIVDVYEVEKGIDVKLVANSYSMTSDYINGMTSLDLVNKDGSTTKTKEELSIDYSGVISIKSSYLTLGDNLITIHSNGYKDYVCTVTVTLSNVPNDVGISNGKGDILKGNSVAYTTSQEFVISLGNKSDYRDNIISMDVDASEISDYTNENSKITVPAAYFTTGAATTVSVIASGYKDKTFEVRILNEGEKFPVPESVEVNNGNITITSEYKSAITKVIFDGTELSAIPYGFFGDSIDLKNKLYSSNGGSYSAGTYDLLIEADGYEDFVVTVTF